MLMDHLQEYNLRDLERNRNYRVLGRTDGTVDPLNLFWTGSALQLRLRATELWVILDSSYMIFENWVDVMVNGALIQRFMVPRGRSEICLFRGMDSNAVRDVRIVRDTQAMHLDPRNSLAVCGLITDGGFEDVPEPALKLEFIGDSLTSGEGLTGASDYLEWNSGCFSAVHTYGYLVSERLGAEYSILSQSGWGACFSFEGIRKEAMPLYYDQVCGVLRGERNRKKGAFDEWDFAGWRPDAVIVNLGTNDEMAIDTVDGCTEPEFEEAVLRFLEKLRRRNPESYLLWCYGMLGHGLEEPIKRAFRRFRRAGGDVNNDYLFLDPAAEEDYGSRDHPGRAAHEKTARVLTEYLKVHLLAPQGEH